MPYDYQAAIDELFGIAAVPLAAANIDVKWPGAPQSAKPAREKTWARVSAQIVTDDQSSLANSAGKKRYHATGLLYVQLFCSRIEANGLDNGRTIAKAVQAAFRVDAPSGVMWFRDQKIRELPITEESYPINVVVTFEYESIQ